MRSVSEEMQLQSELAPGTAPNGAVSIAVRKRCSTLLPATPRKCMGKKSCQDFSEKLHNYLKEIDNDHVELLDYPEKEKTSSANDNLSDKLQNVTHGYIDQMGSLPYYVVRDWPEDQYKTLRGIVLMTRMDLNFASNYINIMRIKTC